MTKWNPAALMIAAVLLRRIEVSVSPNLIHPKIPQLAQEATVARPLATRPDAQNTAVRIASAIELLYYNAWLDYDSKEAADRWLTSIWA